MKKNFQIVLIGAGNVGFHLGKKLHAEGFQITQIFSRKKLKASQLAREINSQPIHRLEDISAEARLYILAISDAAIAPVAQQLSKIIDEKKLVVHTSGATPSTVLKPYFKNYGIFYPLQTFSISRAIDFEKIPICIDSNRKPNRVFLTKLARELSQSVHEIDDRQRAILHVAAVFVNNFSNNLFTIGEKISKKENLPFDILKPLIRETVAKIEHHSSADMQTGPAIRGDDTTINLHLEYLEKNFPEFVEVYLAMTKSIAAQQ